MYKICSQCVMDNIGNDDIFFDQKGICNYCFEYKKKSKFVLLMLLTGNNI